jgi:hypothetical protein
MEKRITKRSWHFTKHNIYKHLQNSSLWHTPCDRSPQNLKSWGQQMRQHLPKKLFLTIAQNMNSENPTWALMLANEYLDSSNPLRLALVAKAQQYTSSQNPIFQDACAGKRMGELTAEEQAQLRESSTCIHESNTQPQRSTRPIPTPRRRVTTGRVRVERRQAVNASL